MRIVTLSASAYCRFDRPPARFSSVVGIEISIRLDLAADADQALAFAVGQVCDGKRPVQRAEHVRPAREGAEWHFVYVDIGGVYARLLPNCRSELSSWHLVYVIGR